MVGVLFTLLKSRGQCHVSHAKTPHGTTYLTNRNIEMAVLSRIEEPQLKSGRTGTYRVATGVTVLAGHVVCLDENSDLVLCSSASSSEHKVAIGISLNKGEAGNTVAVALSGSILTGSNVDTMSASQASNYFVDDTPGGNAGFSDLPSGAHLIRIGFAFNERADVRLDIVDMGEVKA